MDNQKQRFKDKGYNRLYWFWVTITPEQLKEVLKPGSIREQAFRDGYKNYKCKYQRNWAAYPVYVAGKEWRKINNQFEPIEISFSQAVNADQEISAEDKFKEMELIEEENERILRHSDRGAWED